MTTRPRSITVIGWLFIVVGSAGILRDAYELATDGTHRSAELEAEGLIGLGLIWAVRLVAVIGGLLLLGGVSWARRLLVAWMAFHVAISALHSPLTLVLHIAIFAPLTYLLFRAPPPNYSVATRNPPE